MAELLDAAWRESDADVGKYAGKVEHYLLNAKIKFPLLEFAAEDIFSRLKGKDQLAFADAVIYGGKLGGNVIAGKLLQLRVEKHFAQSFAKAVEYILHGNEWYVCDIIGERVMGHSVLLLPDRAMAALKLLARHENPWIVRTVGVATHYAVKKGTPKKYAEELFRLLLTLSGSKETHVKTGAGWGAKTCVKFYPGLAEKYSREINAPATGKWFRTKIKIGLGRAYKYAAKHQR